MSFKDDATNYLLERGVACSEGDWAYGWQDWYSTRDEGHSVGCHWEATPESEVIEYGFSEFQDTFSGNEDKVVLALTHVNCQCRKIKDITIGIKGGAMDLLHDLLGIKKEYRW